MSPRKARLVIDAIRGKDVNDALKIVRLSSKKAAQPI
jgi:ribosomal protein L22